MKNFLLRETKEWGVRFLVIVPGAILGQGVLFIMDRLIRGGCQ